MPAARCSATTRLLVALVLASTLPPAATGAWRRELHGTDAAPTAGGTAEARAVVVDGAGDAIAAGRIVNLGSGAAFTVLKLAASTGGQLWRTEISGTKPEGSVAAVLALDGAGDVVAAGSLGNGGTIAEDFAVVKLAGATGAELWRYELDGFGFDMATAVTVDASGDVIAAGISEVGTFGPDRFTVVKIAGGTGAEVWRRDFAGSDPIVDDGRATGVVVDSAGDVVAVGTLSNVPHRGDFTVIKLAGVTGTELWRQEIDEGLGDEARAVAVDASDDVVVAGTLGPAGNVKDYVVVKFAGATGTELWRQNLTPGEPSSLDEPNAVVVDGAGDVITAGQVDNSATDLDLDFLVAKLAGATGTELWRREINGTISLFSPFDSASAVTVDGSGDVIAAGRVTNKNVFVNHQDFAVMKLDGSTGATEWQQALQGAGTEQFVTDNALAVAADGTGGAVAAGFLTNPPDTRDFTVVRLGALDGAVGPVRGTKLTVRDKSGDATAQALVAVADDQAIMTPLPGGAGDPTLFGGTLRLVNPVTLEVATIPLPASHWTAIGVPPGAGGYEYRDQGTSGPCRLVRVRPRKQMRASCAGTLGTIPFSLDEASQGTLAIGLQLGSAERQCATWAGAAVVKDVGFTGPSTVGVFRARRVNAVQGACP